VTGVCPQVAQLTATTGTSREAKSRFLIHRAAAAAAASITAVVHTSAAAAGSIAANRRLLLLLPAQGVFEPLVLQLDLPRFHQGLCLLY
jgi:hypothetical protein